MTEEPRYYKRGKSLTGERYIIVNPKFFKKFKEDNPDIKISYKEFYDIISSANLKLQEGILNDPSGFKFPLNIGYLAVQKFKPTNRLINRIHRRMTGRSVFNLNLHSFEWMFKVRWFKTTESRMTSKLHCYQFKACRAMKSKLSEIIKSTGGTKYVQYDTKHFYSRKLLEKINKHFKFSSDWD